MDTTLQDPLVGQVLDGRYRVEARIAVGGMATVYRAVDTRLDRVLALKVMHPALATDATFVDRFIREAKSVARLDHPNVVQVFDQGAQGAYVYLAMEYIAGCTLRDVLRERGALQPRAALDILEPVLAALGAAHRAGFVHRDMKPENVLIGDDGRVKVADFGLVRAVDTVTSTTGAVLGTVSYLAPEQIETGTADPRVDVYACGVVLYEMLTGAKPHEGDSPAAVLYKHLHDDVPPPSAAVPELAYELDELVAAATARNPEVRPHDAVALLARIRESRGKLSVEQLDAVPPQALAADHDNAEDRTSVIPRALTIPRPLPVNEDEDGAGGPSDGVQHTSRLASPPPDPPRRRGPRMRRGPLAVVVAVLLVLGLGTGIWYINSGQFTKVPALLSKTEAQARDRLDEAGLDVGKVSHAHSDTVDRGQIISTEPGVGDRIRKNDSVSFTVSDGPDRVKLPDLEGYRLDRARTLLKDEGLEPGMVTKAFSEEVPTGFVVSTKPAAGTTVRGGSAVALVVSKGRPVDVPDVTGDDLDEARTELSEAGLKVKVAEKRVNSEHDSGQVARQTPEPGSEAAEGDTVTLTVSKGPQMVEVPDVVGDSVDDAKQKLEDAGFGVKEDRGLLGLFGDTVKEQSVEGGDTAPKGSSIKITIR
ncbi:MULTISPECIES: Stk1 family PASTA domain-containing Ser/Thr kinase [Streptomyces]|uniref:non-specific serine/threonine protein kinase n=1 Tax=Streptomyces olivaceus TaxID=47716 RepID=A0ABS7WBI6_STROV|nr:MULTISPECIES: Stk1 family PASTA domain-containing Ser/Thr kinase [Streptomyces]AOW86535.1 serine/threonine protein kinase [Streptomyces olivaceus]MBZ6089317.1 Stk1 family PASTA domain-containing Ser/Thr kinase [Streptomyces olivaceus]MBZ6097455.1 Stk1 family PASTA domain-containing Ser/Thr kinase [Streptomyces olivaceus]MBZ6111368.1 Stk1 family PASTA domain-containing Ser/Thr kinase [Streptomyces olivaceus]MBZ6117859.1 Stk1 family PASTA domain-containing Ser/Thr kinase [Streptomyces olivace